MFSYFQLIRKRKLTQEILHELNIITKRIKLDSKTGTDTNCSSAQITDQRSLDKSTGETARQAKFERIRSFNQIQSIVGS